MVDKKRNTGRTTRLADAAVQELYRDGCVVIRDHNDSETSHKYLFNLVKKRLLRENRNGDSKRFVFDKKTLNIKLYLFPSKSGVEKV